jgi:serine/threonine-protein kinase TNNI3K
MNLFQMAPESIKNKEYSFATDAWSFGIFCYEVLDEKEPHEKLDVLDAGVKIRDTNLTPTLPKGTPAFLAKVIESCWNTDPNARPTFDQIVQELGDHILDESSEGGHDEGEAGEERSSSNKNTSSNTTTNTSS